MNPNEKLRQAFMEEASELLASLEGLILDLESDPKNVETLNAVFRVMHTIKGSAGMIGFQKINQFAHRVEDAFDMIRKGTLSFSEESANLALEARDIIEILLKKDEKVDSEIEDQMELFFKRIDSMMGIKPDTQIENSENSEIPSQNNPGVALHPEPGESTYFLEFSPDPDIFLRGLKPLTLIDELNQLGMVTVISLLDKIPPLSDINEEKCYSSWELYVSTEEPKSAVEQVFKFVATPKTLQLREITDTHDKNGEVKRLGEILESKGLVSRDDLDSALKSQRKLGEVLVEEKRVSRSQLESALKEQEHLKKINIKKSSLITGSIRVSTEKLDKFVNLVGELVTLSAQLEQVAKQMGNMELEGVSENLQRLMEDLRDSALGIRMVPIGESFNGFRRLVRDLSLELGKDIRLETEGNETELDKTVIDRLSDPLMHLIRNCIDHGIESPEIRKKSGKDPVGFIKLGAKHSGGNVVITIEDDGAGLNKRRIRAKAIERGLLLPDEELKEENIYKLIFMSGFSTAETVSKVSGRGVGMDVVKREIDSLGGHISISSQEGKNTKMSFTLPLTMAIIDGLLLRLEDDYYIVPLASVESCLEMDEVQDSRLKGEGDIIHYRDQFIPYIRLRKYLEYSSKPPALEQLVVIKNEDTRYGIVVGQVIGDHQTVIKNMGKVFKHVRGFSGATILGSGQVALILNVALLNNLYKETEDRKKK